MDFWKYFWYVALCLACSTETDAALGLSHLWRWTIWGEQKVFWERGTNTQFWVVTNLGQVLKRYQCSLRHQLFFDRVFFFSLNYMSCLSYCVACTRWFHLQACCMLNRYICFCNSLGCSSHPDGCCKWFGRSTVAESFLLYASTITLQVYKTPYSLSYNEKCSGSRCNFHKNSRVIKLSGFIAQTFLQFNELMCN